MEMKLLGDHHQRVLQHEAHNTLSDAINRNNKPQTQQQILRTKFFPQKTRQNAQTQNQPNSTKQPRTHRPERKCRRSPEQNLHPDASRKARHSRQFCALLPALFLCFATHMHTMVHSLVDKASVSQITGRGLDTCCNACS